MRILITGATGYIGTTVVPYLLEHEYCDICLLVRNLNKAKLIYNDKVQYISLEGVSWRSAVLDYNPECVIHLAGLLDSRHDANTVDNIIKSNILFTTQLLESISHTNCMFFINAASCLEYRNGELNTNPNTLYAASKLAVHPIIKFFQSISSWRWVNVVIYSAYGKRNMHPKILDLIYDALDSPVAHPFTEGEQVLDFIHVNDIASFFYTLLNKLYNVTESYTEFHLGTGFGYSLREVASIMENITGKKVNAQWGAFPYRPHEVMCSVAPIDKNVRMLNWRASYCVKDKRNFV